MPGIVVRARAPGSRRLFTGPPASPSAVGGSPAERRADVVSASLTESRAKARPLCCRSLSLEVVARRQPERVDQAAVAHVRHDRPAQLHDLLGREVPCEVVEQLLVDVLMVDVEALRVAERGLLAIREVTV